MKSTVGRPRRVTDEHIRTILAWHAELVALKEARKAVKTIRQVAKELNLSPATIGDVVRNGGIFSQPTPELRQATIDERRARLKPRPRRRPGLSDEQKAAIAHWRGERQAVREEMRSIPSETAMARELRMGRDTLNRLLLRGNREASVSAGGGRRIRRLNTDRLQRLHAWQSMRESALKRASLVPSARAFAAQLQISLTRLQRAVARGD